MYFDPWQRHSNHWLASHSCGTWQPRCGHLRQSAMIERSAKGASSSTSAPGSATGEDTVPPPSTRALAAGTLMMNRFAGP